MKIDRVYLKEGAKRRLIDSLSDALAFEDFSETRMLRRLIPESERENCRWIGYAIAKGVTHPEQRISVVAAPGRLPCGLHGELVQGFRAIRVDPIPLCYENVDHKHGFGGFVRWVYLIPRNNRPGYIGIDWGYTLRSTGGVANTMKRVVEVSRVLLAHGLHRVSKVVLLGPRMLENPAWRKWRLESGLITLADWCGLGANYFLRSSEFCPRCGTRAFEQISARYCFACGCNQKLILSPEHPARR